MGVIAPLPGGVVSHLRSSTILSDFEQAVEELVCNSLDAGATEVRIQLDESGATVIVEDDGHGISRDDFTLLGVRHATSKLHTVEELEAGLRTLGFRGEALSSMSDISLVEITSRAQGCPHTYRKIMKGGKTISLGLCSQQRARGTTVVLRDIFYNQPVRRRLFNPRKSLQAVKERVLRLALAHPYISYIVADSSREEKVLHIRRQTSLYGTLQEAFGRELCSGLQEVDFAQGKLRLSGFLSKTFSHTSSKAIQYLYINHRFVHKTPLHKMLNAWGRRRDHCPSSGSQSRNVEMDICTWRQAYPAYVLNLSCPPSKYDITFESTKTYVEFEDWTSVLSFLENVLITRWGKVAGRKEDVSEAEALTLGKRKLWCRSDYSNKSILERNVKSKQMQMMSKNVQNNDFSSLPRLTSSTFNKKIMEADVIQYPDNQLLVKDLQSRILSPLIKPEFSKEDCLDLEMKSPSFSMPLSPVVSDGSWECEFQSHEEDDHIELRELNNTSDWFSMDEEIKPAQFFSKFHGSSSAIHPCDSRFAVKEKSLSMGILEDEWMIPEATLPCDMFVLPLNARKVPDCEEQQQEASFSIDAVAQNSGPDMEEVSIELNSTRSHMHRLHMSPVHSPRLLLTLDAEDRSASMSSPQCYQPTNLAEGQGWNSTPESPTHDPLLSKWRSMDEGIVHSGDGDLSQHAVASMYKIWLNPCMRATPNDVLELSSGILGSNSSSLLPHAVTKESLQYARVLQQVDTKFIAVVAQNVLLLVDQHAADERVRLEEFRAQVLSADKKQCSTLLEENIQLILGLTEQQTLYTYQKQIEDWGWQFQAAPISKELSKDSQRDGGGCKFHLNSVPCILGVNLSAADLEEYLHQLGATEGASVPPPAVMRLLNFKSCRGAIMFGDSLLPGECRQLVNHLKRTSLCFQNALRSNLHIDSKHVPKLTKPGKCAHGRPTMVPLVNLRSLRHQFKPSPVLSNQAQLEMQINSEAGWHNLKGHSVSLLRARERLLHTKPST